MFNFEFQIIAFQESKLDITQNSILQLLMWTGKHTIQYKINSTSHQAWFSWKMGRIQRSCSQFRWNLIEDEHAIRANEYHKRCIWLSMVHFKVSKICSIASWIWKVHLKPKLSQLTESLKLYLGKSYRVQLEPFFFFDCI